MKQFDGNVASSGKRGLHGIAVFKAGIRARIIPIEGTSKNAHHRRAAEFQPSSTCKNLDCLPGSLRLLQAKSV